MEYQMLRRFSLIGAVAAALFFPLPASAGSAFKGGATNPGGKYVPYGGGVGKFHTNPGGKYVYRGYGSKFHTNPGGKYVYPGWSGKYDHNHRYTNYGRYHRYGYYGWYGLPLYSYGEGCGWLYRRAVARGSDYWWDRYRRCIGTY